MRWISLWFYRILPRIAPALKTPRRQPISRGTYPEGFVRLLALSSLALGLALASCGKDAGDGDRKGSDAGTTRRSANRPKTRTANTPLAANEDCYKPDDEALCAMAKRIFAMTNEKR